MELAWASFSHVPMQIRASYETKPGISFANSTRNWSVRKLLPHLASTRTYATPVIDYELENKKYDLLQAVQETKRGVNTTSDQRSSIEEALVNVEGYDAGEAINLSQLDGTWRLQYTSAPDVLVLFEAAARLPIFQVGQVFQKFECLNGSDGGVVQNVVKWSAPKLLDDPPKDSSKNQYIVARSGRAFSKLVPENEPLAFLEFAMETLLAEEEGGTLVVSAKFSVVSKRNVYLKFEQCPTPSASDIISQISLQDLKISEQLQAVLAPAIVPRTFLSLQILQFIRTFKVQIPVSNPERQSVGGLYYLSYLDNNMLLGRAVGGGGAFVFTRSQPLIC